MRFACCVAGTLVIRGSHKLGPEVPISEVIDGALSEPSLGLVSQVVDVPAGSTLIFFESLLHASGIITSGRDRLLVIAGYVAVHATSVIPSCARPSVCLSAS